MNPAVPPVIAGMLSVVVAVGLASLPALAHAANPAGIASQSRQAETVAAQAKQAFKNRRFEHAARLFMKAYAISKQPALVFNAARAYQEANKPGEAVSLFRLYATLSTDPDGIADAWARIKKLEGKGEPAAPVIENPVPPKPSEPVVPPPSEVVPADGKPENIKPVEATPVDPEVQEVKRAVLVAPTVAVSNPPTDRTWAWVAIGSAAVLAGGASLAWLGAQRTEQANRLPFRSQSDIDAYNASFDQAELLMNTGMALAAVGLVAGGAATWLHFNNGATISAGPDARGGVWLAGRW